MDDADVDALPGDDQGAAAADPSLDAQRFGGRGGWGPAGRASRRRACSAGVSGLGRLRSSMPPASELQQAAVEADGEASAGVLDADRVLPAGEADQAGGVDQPVDLDRRAGLGGRRWGWVVGRRVGRRRRAAGAGGRW